VSWFYRNWNWACDIWLLIALCAEAMGRLTSVTDVFSAAGDVSDQRWRPSLPDVDLLPWWILMKSSLANSQKLAKMRFVTSASRGIISANHCQTCPSGKIYRRLNFRQA
jgi:hypothetical protein